jgi:uncharacterized protein (DUF4415 family)
MPARRPTNRTRQVQHRYLMDRMQQLEWDLHQQVVYDWTIPGQWREIAGRTPRSEKTRVTIRVETDVVKFFKSMGAGYQVRMNEVLASFMHAKLAGLLHDEEEIAAFAREKATGPRPELGDTDRLFREMEAGDRGEG